MDIVVMEHLLHKRYARMQINYGLHMVLVPRHPVMSPHTPPRIVAWRQEIHGQGIIHLGVKMGYAN